MKPLQFDSVAKLFSSFKGNQRLSRRQMLTHSAAIQEATPDAEPPANKSTAMLFVQSYQSGSIAPTEGVEGRYTLTLEQGHGQTVYFSDRPERVVGASPTPQFLEGLGFIDENPPNAALVVETPSGETDVAVVELFNPIYDPLTQGVTYEVEVLVNWQGELGLDFTEAPTDLASLTPSFGSAQLFIDDCSNSDIWCVSPGRQVGDHIEDRVTYGTVSKNAEMCWNYSLCQPCEPYGHTYPDYCAGYNYWRRRCNETYNNCFSSTCLPFWHWLQPWCN